MVALTCLLRWSRTWLLRWSLVADPRVAAGFVMRGGAAASERLRGRATAGRVGCTGIREFCAGRSQDLWGTAPRRGSLTLGAGRSATRAVQLHVGVGLRWALGYCRPMLGDRRRLFALSESSASGSAHGRPRARSHGRWGDVSCLDSEMCVRGHWTLRAM